MIGEDKPHGFAPRPRVNRESAPTGASLNRFPAVRLELNRILASLERITARGERAFLDPDDEINYLAGSQLIINFDDLIRHRLPPSVRENHPEIPWRQITRTRNILAHEYLAADRALVWTAVSKEFPELVRSLLG